MQQIGHASIVENQPERRETRSEEIGDRITAIRARLGELRQARQENRHPVTSSEQFIEAPTSDVQR